MNFKIGTIIFATNRNALGSFFVYCEDCKVSQVLWWCVFLIFVSLYDRIKIFSSTLKLSYFPLFRWLSVQSLIDFYHFHLMLTCMEKWCQILTHQWEERSCLWICVTPSFGVFFREPTKMNFQNACLLWWQPQLLRYIRKSFFYFWETKPIDWGWSTFSKTRVFLLMILLWKLTCMLLP